MSSSQIGNAIVGSWSSRCEEGFVVPDEFASQSTQAMESETDIYMRGLCRGEGRAALLATGVLGLCSRIGREPRSVMARLRGLRGYLPRT